MVDSRKTVCSQKLAPMRHEPRGAPSPAARPPATTSIGRHPRVISIDSTFVKCLLVLADDSAVQSCSGMAMTGKVVVEIHSRTCSHNHGTVRAAMNRCRIGRDMKAQPSSPPTSSPPPPLSQLSAAACLRPARCSAATTRPRADAQGARLVDLTGGGVCLRSKPPRLQSALGAPRFPALSTSASERPRRRAAPRRLYSARSCSSAWPPRGLARSGLGGQDPEPELQKSCLRSWDPRRHGQLPLGQRWWSGRYGGRQDSSTRASPSFFLAPATVSSGDERRAECRHGSSPAAGATERCGFKATILEGNDINLPLLQGMLLLHGLKNVGHPPSPQPTDGSQGREAVEEIMMFLPRKFPTLTSRRAARILTAMASGREGPFH